MAERSASGILITNYGSLKAQVIDYLMLPQEIKTEMFEIARSCSKIIAGTIQKYIILLRFNKAEISTSSQMRRGIICHFISCAYAAQ